MSPSGPSVCVCVCLFVSLRLRGVEKRGRTEPTTKLICQIPVTLETFSQLRPSTHTMRTAPLFVSFVCFLFASSSTLSLSSGPWSFLACLFDLQRNIYALHKVKGTVSEKTRGGREYVHVDLAKKQTKGRDYQNLFFLTYHFFMQENKMTPFA